MTQPNKSKPKTIEKSSARKTKSATRAAPADKALQQSQLDEISAGKLLAERHRKELKDTDA
ncbi:MAG TPA: hypothetical protein VF797_02260 [Noviherbaspirillum sp.]|jgi:hypothetical protein